MIFTHRDVETVMGFVYSAYNNFAELTETNLVIHVVTVGIVMTATYASMIAFLILLGAKFNLKQKIKIFIIGLAFVVFNLGVELYFWFNVWHPIR